MKNLKTWWLLLIMLFVLFVPVMQVSADVQLTSVMQAKTYTASNGVVLPYRIYVPQNYDASRRYSFLLFLHGAGERGTDNTVHISKNINIAVRIVNDNVLKDDCIIIAPQCPSNMQWVDTPWGNGNYSLDSVAKSKPMSAVEGLIALTRSTYNIDSNRLYVSGISMGGFGTWDISMRNPGMFAAAIPVCGASDPTKASLIKDLPIWTFHGSADTTVPVAGTRAMVAALRAIGSDVKYTEYAGVGHGSWTNAFNEPDLLTWLFSQKREITNEYDMFSSILSVKSTYNTSASILASCYNAENQLMHIEVISMQAFERNVVIPFDFSGLTVINPYKIKFMVWDNMQNMKPVSDSIEVFRNS